MYLQTGSREGGILDVKLCVVGHKVEVVRDPMKRTRMYICLHLDLSPLQLCAASYSLCHITANQMTPCRNNLGIAKSIDSPEDFVVTLNLMQETIADSNHLIARHRKHNSFAWHLSCSVISRLVSISTIQVRSLPDNTSHITRHHIPIPTRDQAQY